MKKDSGIFIAWQVYLIAKTYQGPISYKCMSHTLVYLNKPINITAVINSTVWRPNMSSSDNLHNNAIHVHIVVCHQVVATVVCLSQKVLPLHSCLVCSLFDIQWPPEPH